MQFFWFSFSARFSQAAGFWRKGPIRIRFLYLQPPTGKYREITAMWIITALSALRSGKKNWKNGKKAIVQFPNGCRASLPSSIISILHQKVTGLLTAIKPDTSGAAGAIAEEDKTHLPQLWQSGFPRSCCGLDFLFMPRRIDSIGAGFHIRLIMMHCCAKRSNCASLRYEIFSSARMLL